MRTLVGALSGPNDFFGASEFFWMNDVWFASPLYVPSGFELSVSLFIGRVLPSSAFASEASSSYQLECFVASLLLCIWGVGLADVASAASALCVGRWPADDVLIAPLFFFRRLIVGSSLSEEKSESSLSDFGVAGRFRCTAFPFGARLLNCTTGAGASAVVGSVSAILLEGRERRMVVCSGKLRRKVGGDEWERSMRMRATLT